MDSFHGGSDGRREVTHHPVVSRREMYATLLSKTASMFGGSYVESAVRDGGVCHHAPLGCFGIETFDSLTTGKNEVLACALQDDDRF